MDNKQNSKLGSEKRIQLNISALAFAKMLLMVMIPRGEIAWHAEIERVSGTVYKVSEVHLFKQFASSTYVCVNPTEYAIWLSSQPKKVLKKLNSHWHSHVEKGTTPSEIDFKSRWRQYSQLMSAGTGFYLYAIMNKSGDIDIMLYDADAHCAYTREDCDIVIGDKDECFNLQQFSKLIEDNIKGPEFSKPIEDNIKWPDCIFIGKKLYRFKTAFLEDAPLIYADAVDDEDDEDDVADESKKYEYLCQEYARGIDNYAMELMKQCDEEI